jgi:hypothetical protein
MPIDSQMTSDPVASGGMEGPERIFHWSRWAGPIHSYYSEEVAGRARKSPVWWIVRTSSSAVNWPGFQFTNADSIQYTFVIVADGRRTVEAMLLEPVPADTATTRKILGSVRILSDGE